VLRGRPIDDLLERFRVVSGDAFELFRSLERVAGERHTHRGEVKAAREVLSGLLASADERGEYWSYAWVRMGLCELELRAGEWEAATRLLEEWEQSLDPFVQPVYARCRALLAAGRGLPDEAEHWAEQAEVELARSSIWHRVEVRRARGMVALFRGHADRAVDELGHIWEHTQREGIDDPGVFPVAPDLVEALVDSGRGDDADRVTERLGALAQAQDHPWGLASWKRCRGMFDEAAREYGRLGLRFDRARTLLACGRMERRRRHWAAARNALGTAAEAFENMGSVGWAEHARAEFDRIGGRRPSPAGALTPSELRVAELAAEGLANKEIAQVLSLSVHTIEDHLSHTYAKLGIRSRSQLARRLPMRE
jgi:ATP/maltotriose-dependent transcriptional regulator MalT